MAGSVVVFPVGEGYGLPQKDSNISSVFTIGNDSCERCVASFAVGFSVGEGLGLPQKDSNMPSVFIPSRELLRIFYGAVGGGICCRGRACCLRGTTTSQACSPSGTTAANSAAQVS